jgi:hypothetical protein
LQSAFFRNNAIRLSIDGKGAEIRRYIVSSPSNDGARRVVPTQQARQGVTGHNVRYVLAWSVAAVVVVFGVIYFAYFGGGR